MRIAWVEVGGEFLSAWEEHDIMVARDDTGWRIWVDGQRVEGAHRTPRAAMDATAYAVDRQIARRHVPAKQPPPLGSWRRGAGA